MKVEVKRPEPVPAMVTIEVTEACAQLLRLSMGYVSTGRLRDPAGAEHFALYQKLGEAVGEGPYVANFDKFSIIMERK